MENLNKECCLTCYLCNVKELLENNPYTNTKKPCKHYPENLSAKGEILQVYCCEHYSPVIHKLIPSPSINKVNIKGRKNKKRIKIMSRMQKQMLKQLEGMGFHKLLTIDEAEKKEGRAFLVGLTCGITIGYIIGILTIIALTIGVGIF